MGGHTLPKNRSMKHASWRAQMSSITSKCFTIVSADTATWTASVQRYLKVPHLEAFYCPRFWGQFNPTSFPKTEKKAFSEVCPEQLETRYYYFVPISSPTSEKMNGGSQVRSASYHLELHVVHSHHFPTTLRF